MYSFQRKGSWGPVSCIGTLASSQFCRICNSCLAKIETLSGYFQSAIMTTKLASLPLGGLSSRNSIAGAPLRVNSHSRDRHLGAKITAIAAPERLNYLDNAEEARLQETDAFAELKALASRQSVNRPQKVSEWACIGSNAYNIASIAHESPKCHWSEGNLAKEDGWYIVLCILAGGVKLSTKPYIPGLLPWEREMLQ